MLLKVCDSVVCEVSYEVWEVFERRHIGFVLLDDMADCLCIHKANVHSSSCVCMAFVG